MKTIFWNVDTQYDFMRDDESFRGGLPVPDARTIEGNLAKLTRFAERNGIYVVNTADWHTLNDEEIDAEKPDFIKTYPPHCMAGAFGAEYILATRPKEFYRLTRDAKQIDLNKLVNTRNLIIEKYQFDVFAGNPLAEKAVDILSPEKVVVYGVALNVCDDFAVMGNVRKGREVYAVLDAMKDLPHLKGTPLDTEKVLEKWKNAGVKLTTTKNILESRI
jgi:nicotinamidase/pyrazinamidase